MAKMGHEALDMVPFSFPWRMAPCKNAPPINQPARDAIDLCACISRDARRNTLCERAATSMTRSRCRPPIDLHGGRHARD